MNINSISQSNFGAKFSPELESKLIACGKLLKRSNKAEEYEQLKEATHTIRNLFPEGTIAVKPVCKLEIIKDINGKELLKMPVYRANIFLERYGETDVSLIKNGLLSANCKLELEHVKEIANRLQRYKRFMDSVESTPEKEAALETIIKKDLIL